MYFTLCILRQFAYSICGFDIPLSFAYVIFIVFWQVGFSNAVNLTDGLDGLATGLSIIGFAMYAVMSYMLDSPAIGIFCIIMISLY